MRKATIVALVLCFGLAVRSAWSAASVEWEILKSFSLDQKPVDTVISMDDRWLFVLTDKGKVLVYSNKDGTQVDTLDVGAHIDRIGVGSRDNTLYLMSSSKQTVDAVRLDFVHNIRTDGSPFMGPADAPVVIAVFTDFQ